MSLVIMVLVLAAIGVGLWFLNKKVTMEPWIKTLINIIVIAVVILWVLNATGIWGEVKAVKVPQL